MGVSKIRGTILRGPLIRIKVFWGFMLGSQFWETTKSHDEEVYQVTWGYQAHRRSDWDTYWVVGRHSKSKRSSVQVTSQPWRRRC